MAAETVELPAIGRVEKRWVWVGGALIVGIVGYAYWQRSRQRAADNTDPLAIEPEQADTGGAYTNPRPVNSTVDGTDPDAITTNAQWTAKVTDRLSSLGIFDTAFIGATLGKYLSRIPLTPDEQDLVRTAWAYVGKPPEGPDNFTPKGSGPNDPTPPGKLPAPTGFRQGDAQQWQNAARLDWNPVPGAAGYVLEEVTGQAGGWTSPLEVGTVNATMKYGLVHAGSYHVRIAAKDSAGTIGEYSPTIVVRTHN